MAEVITNAGERLIAEKQGSGEALIIDRVILSHDPDIDPSDPIDRNTGLPGSSIITYQDSVTQAAWVTPNEVVYSLFLDSKTGPFKFNRMDLVASSDNVNVAISTFPVQDKIADNPGEDIRGQNMTRNMVLVFDGAKTITQITIEAEAWQWNFDNATEESPGLAEISTLDEALEGRLHNKFITPYILDYMLNRAVFPGFIAVFAGTENQISTGWQLCNGVGTTSNGIKVPDLRDRMIICAGKNYDIGDKGGSETSTTSSKGSHSHTITVYGHTLTTSQIPSHNHQQVVSGLDNNQGNSMGYTVGNPTIGYNGSNNTSKDSTRHTGSSGSHNHGANSLSSGSHTHTVNTLSPYYALALIIKL